MEPARTARFAAISLALLATLAPRATLSQSAQEPYPGMAPVEQYLIRDRDQEIALARSAAPESISRDAEVLVLGRSGYEKAVEGKNGFVCVVQRSWTAGPQDTDFWNPKLRAPICFNAVAARTYLPRTIQKTRLVMAGRTKAQMFQPDRRRHPQQRAADTGTGRDVLHDVETRVSERSRPKLASAFDVFHADDRARSLGRGLARVACSRV